MAEKIIQTKKRDFKIRPAIVYVAVNIINGKKYIGVTYKPLNRRATEHRFYARKGVHNYPLYRAMRKYGFNAIEFFILAEYSNYEDALAGEIYFIQLLKPEYNATLGGQGRVGHKMPDHVRKKLHRPRTEKEKNHLRELGLKNKDKWKQYSHLGPKAFSRKVICLDDGKIYESASAAARAYDSAKSAVIELCLGKNFRRTVNGRRFKYVDSRVAREGTS